MFKPNDNQSMDVDYFNEMINFLSPFVPSKTNIEEYKCFRFKNNEVFVGDSDFCAKFSLNDCNFSNKKFAISSKTLIGLANKFDVGNRIKFELEDDKITIKSGNYVGKFPILIASEFNEFSEPIKTCNVPDDFLDGIIFLTNSRSKKVHEAKRALLLGATFKENCGYTTNMNMVSKYEFNDKEHLLDFVMPHMLFDVIKKNKMKPTQFGIDDRYIYAYYGNSIYTKCKRYAVDSEKYVDLEKFYNDIYNFSDMAKVDAQVIDIISAIERLKVIKGTDGFSKLKFTILNNNEFKIENIDGNAKGEELIKCTVCAENNNDKFQAISNADNFLYLFSQYKDTDEEDGNVSFYLSNTGKKMIISDKNKSNIISCIQQ